MKAGLFALSVGSLLGSALSIHARHAAFHEKRGGDVAPPSLDYPCCKTVVTVTVYPTPAATPEAPPGPEKKYGGDAAAPTPAAPYQAPVVPSAAPVGSKPGGAGVITNGKKWAMTYTPYEYGGGCKSASGVLADLQDIKAKGFTTIRLYGTDCDGLSNVGGGAKQVGLKIILGIFIKGDGIEAARPQLGQIVNWGNAGNWDIVVMLVVGNEALHSGATDAPSLAAFISSAKGALTAAGQGSIPVTTTETVATLGQYKDVLCPVIDVIGANIQTFFDGKVLASEAGAFALSQLEQVKNFCPGKPYYNLESGWPSGGASNGASIASPEAQKAAMASISEAVGDRTVVFSYKDDGWKSAGIEQHFGCSEWY